MLCKAIGVKHIRTVNPLDLEETKRVIAEEMERPETSVIITDKPCVLVKREGVFERGLSRGNGRELHWMPRLSEIGCPAIEWIPAKGRRGGPHRSAALYWLRCLPSILQVSMRSGGQNEQRDYQYPPGGVGGQGILLASEILSETFMLAGFDVKKSEIHGMSQRGGSVVSHVRYGKEVFSPMVPEGEGDILFGFELMETCRALPLLARAGRLSPTTCKSRPRPC